MIETTRRTFLRGTFSLIGARILPCIPSFLPTIFLDGLHDDGPGLNALLRGDPVTILDEAAVSRPSAQAVLLRTANILTREMIVLPDGGPYLCLEDCYIEGRDLPDSSRVVLNLKGLASIVGLKIEVDGRVSPAGQEKAGWEELTQPA